MNAASPAIPLHPVTMHPSSSHMITGFKRQHRQSSHGDVIESPTRLRRAGLVVLVAAAHAAGLVVFGWIAPQRPVAPDVTPIQVALLQTAAPEPPALQPPAPEVQQPAPPKVEPRTPPKPRSQTVHKPAPVAPAPTQANPAPTAITTEAPTPQPVAATAPAAAAPTPAAAPAPAPVTAARFDAAYLNNPAPPYPPLSRRMREEGKVLFKVRVSAAGLPVDIELVRSSGSERLDRAAEDVLGGYKFVPARQGDQPIESWVIVPFIFKLQDN